MFGCLDRIASSSTRLLCGDFQPPPDMQSHIAASTCHAEQCHSSDTFSTSLGTKKWHSRAVAIALLWLSWCEKKRWNPLYFTGPVVREHNLPSHRGPEGIQSLFC
jgi:hypothetical protein